MISDPESYDSHDEVRERDSDSDSADSDISEASTESAFFGTFVRWIGMAARPEPVQLADATIDKLSASLASSSSFGLKHFSGNKDAGGLDDVNRWMDDYEDMCGVNNWDDRTKCKKIPAFLAGGARDFFRKSFQQPLHAGA